MLTTTSNNIVYKFVPKKLMNLEQIERHKLVLQNDVFEKYEATVHVQGELIQCANADVLPQRRKKLVRETYAEYEQILANRDPKKDTWIYNILNGVSEKDSVYYADEICVVFPSFVYDGKDVGKLHLLCMPTDITLRSIRSLTANHIKLLQEMKETTLAVVHKKFGLEEGDLKLFFHYEPSTYHLHLHCMNVSNTEGPSSVEYSHELNTVLFNLSIKSDYYQTVELLTRRVAT